MQILLKKLIASIAQYSAISSSDGHERHFFSSLVNMQLVGNEVDWWSIAQEALFPINYFIDQPRFQSNTRPNGWYIARIFRIWSAQVRYEELAWSFKPIRNGEIFWIIITIIFSKLASRRNPPNPAIWLVPRAGGFLRFCPLTRGESLAASFF